MCINKIQSTKKQQLFTWTHSLPHLISVSTHVCMAIFNSCFYLTEILVHFDVRYLSIMWSADDSQKYFCGYFFFCVWAYVCMLHSRIKLMREKITKRHHSEYIQICSTISANIYDSHPTSPNIRTQNVYLICYTAKKPHL